MDILLNILKYVGIIVAIISVITLIIFLIGLVKGFIKSMLIINNIENLMVDFYNQNTEQSYVWFEHHNDSGLGRIYNKGDEENPNLYVICFYTKTTAIQHVKFSDLTKIIPVKILPLNGKENNNNNE